MKKIKICLIALILLLLILPTAVFAAGSIKPSTTSLSIKKGSTKTFKVTASNACGRVDISSSNSAVAKVNVSSQWLENNSVTVTVTGVSAGTAKITVRLSDAATFDEEELSGSYIVNVTVTDPQANTGSSDNNSGSNNSKPSTSTNNNLSKNNNVKGLSVKGYELKNSGNNTYELTVNNNVTNITINGEAEDSKAKIRGIGNKELSVGKNKFTVTVTSESGAKKNYTINVTRKDGFYLDDIKELLKDSSNEKKEITIKKDNNITVDNLNAVKESKQTVSFNYYNEDKKMVYSWVIDGALVKEPTEFNTNLNFVSEHKEEIGKLSNYADGLYLNFEHSGQLPEGTKIKVFVGDKFKDNENVNVYYHNKDNSSLDTIKKELVVTEGYIEFDIKHCSDYFVTRSEIQGTAMPSNNINIFVIISIIEFLVIISLIVVMLLNKKKNN